MTGLVTPDQIESFRNDGFVVVPDLLGIDELERYGPAVEEAVRIRKTGDRRPLDEKSRYEQSFIQCQNLWEDFPAIRPLTFHPRLGRAAAELLGVEAVRLWHDQALVKEAHGRPTDAHQDQPYWPIREPDTVTAWIPFRGSTLAGGAMAYLPGSHLVGLRRFVDIFFSDEPEDIVGDPELAGIDPVYVEVPPGGVAFHHGLTVHLARANETDDDRTVHTIIYFADGCTRGSPFPHYSVDRAGIEVGQTIDGPATPIVWPRTEGSLPPTPEPLDAELTTFGSAGTFPRAER